MRIRKHDLHVHTHLSLCSGDPTATLENYIKRAKALNVEVLGISDHMWDTTNVPGANDWYQEQPYERQLAIREQMPKEIEGVKILWGCETEYAQGIVGITPERAALLDYVLIPHSHFHMKGFTIPEVMEQPREIAQYAVQTFKEVVQTGLATGIAHPFDPCRFNEEEFRAFFASISDEAFGECFGLAKENNVSVEINLSSFAKGVRDSLYDQTYYRMLHLAKEIGCKFHFGSDTHSIEGLGLVEEEAYIIKKLGLSLEHMHESVR